MTTRPCLPHNNKVVSPASIFIDLIVIEAPDPKTIGQDEQPPPYSPAVVTSHINCRVCQAQISLEGRQHLHVIKCSNCNEATVSIICLLLRAVTDIDASRTIG